MKKKTSLKTIEKLWKYKDLEIEIEETCKLTKNNSCPSRVIGALEFVKKETENYISKISGNIGITELQKNVLLGTAHILRRSVSNK